MSESISPVDESSRHNIVLPSLINPSLLDASVTGNTLEDTPESIEDLKPAFELFNDLSAQLADSYLLLEQRVTDLNSELSRVSEQRIEELKDKEQLANRLENLINFLPGGVIVLDHRGSIAQSNPAAESMLETSLHGKLWRDVIQRCFSPKSDDGHEVSNHLGQRINISTRSLGKDGQIILLTDQTETRQLQAELSRHERLTALGKMVSTLAHQVRTPLSSAMLYGSHLLNENLSPTQQHQFTEKLVNRLHEMERQVRDMLLFVKADMLLDDVISVAELQQQLSESLEMPFRQCPVNCTWIVQHSDTPLHCNRDALMGALLNIVNNSLQAMEEGGDLSISFTVCQKSQQLHISVEDTGSGIADEISPYVTELFYTTKAQGTGIGLSVVNTVAKAHGGRFSLESTGQGVCANLYLPIL